MILVTGGTGLVGSHLMLRLLEKGLSLKALRRTESDILTVKKVFSYYTQDPEPLFKKIEWVTADLLDIDALQAAFNNVTHVYHCAALISFDPADENILNKINVEGTSNVVNLCLAHKVQKLCYVSSIAAIGKKPQSLDPIDENEDWNDHHANVYALSKNAAEMEIWRGSQEGLPMVIVNPGVILGPGFWNAGSGILFKMAAKNYRFYPPGGSGFVSVGDVADAMVALMDASIFNERFLLVAENCSYKSVLVNIKTHLGVVPPKKQLPFWLLEILWRLDWIQGLFGKKRSLTKNTVRSLKHRVIYNNQKIKMALGFTFQPIDDIVAFTSRKYLEAHR